MKPFASVTTSRQQFRIFAQQPRLPSRPVDAGPVPAFAGPSGSFGERIRRYLAWVRPHRWTLAEVILLSLMTMSIDVLWPLVSAYVIDDVVLNPALDTNRKVQLIRLTCVVLLVLAALSCALRWRHQQRSQTLTLRVAFDLRRRLFRHILRLPLSTTTEMRVGSIQSRLSTDVDNTTGLLQQAFILPLVTSVRLLVTLAVTFRLDARIATFVLLVCPFIILGHFLHGRQVRPIWRSIEQDRRDVDGRVNEVLGGLRVVRSFRREKYEELAFAGRHNTAIRKQLFAGHRQRQVALIWNATNPTIQLLTIGFGAYLAVLGETTVGVLVAFQAYIWRAFEHITQIAGSISTTQQGLASLEHVTELLDRTSEESDAVDARDAPETVTRLSFEGVGFEYVPGAPVIADFSLSVERGSVVALVGPSGAGKSTLLDLVARFRDPTHGAIRLNGVDLREIRRKSYRSLVGVVSQDVFLFAGTIADNIAYGRPNATLDEIVQAAKQANAHEFIEQMPDGYASWVGERGFKLSGGQRQRLSIARVLLAKPEIVILDEPTSNLDADTEQGIQAELERFTADRLTFVTAHRLSMLRRADVIIVLGHGRIVERGTHGELMALRGKYHDLFVLQHADATRGRPNDNRAWAELPKTAE